MLIESLHFQWKFSLKLENLIKIDLKNDTNQNKTCKGKLRKIDNALVHTGYNLIFQFPVYL